MPGLRTQVAKIDISDRIIFIKKSIHLKFQGYFSLLSVVALPRKPLESMSSGVAPKAF